MAWYQEGWGKGGGTSAILERFYDKLSKLINSEFDLGFQRSLCCWEKNKCCKMFITGHYVSQGMDSLICLVG
ncbi:MAG: hypothetical protein Ct9H300mP21_06590 [Pseudomonadota bacterium]|nr:MAG: hypothetical protein Ct9H300mP21_06590 [Pseudomonadota bacterium]